MRESHCVCMVLIHFRPKGPNFKDPWQIFDEKLRFAPILLATRSKYVSEDSKRMKKNAVEKVVCIYFVNFVYFIAYVSDDFKKIRKIQFCRKK